MPFSGFGKHVASRFGKSEVARASAIALGLKMLGVLLAFLLQVVLARYLGVAGFGQYALALTICTILAYVGCMGTDNAMLKVVAADLSRHEHARMKAHYLAALILCVLFSGTLTAIMVAWPNEVADLFEAGEGFESLVASMAAGILPYSLYLMHGQALQGAKKPAEAVLVLAVISPIVSLLMALYVVPSHGVHGAVFCFVVGCMVTLAYAVLRWVSFIKGVQALPVRAVMGGLARSSFIIFQSTVLGLLVSWMPLLLLGVLASHVDVGMFSVANRTALLTSFLMNAINGVLASRFSALHANGQLRELERLAIRSARITVLLALPVVLALVFCGKLVMGVFGHEFISAAPALAVMAAGQLISVACGSVGYLLIMSGNEHEIRNAQAITLIVELALCLALIPHYGFMGAAIASCVAVACLNFFAAYRVRRVIGISMLPFMGASRV